MVPCLVKAGQCSTSGRVQDRLVDVVLEDLPCDISYQTY